MADDISPLLLSIDIDSGEIERSIKAAFKGISMPEIRMDMPEAPSVNRKGSASEVQQVARTLTGPIGKALSAFGFLFKGKYNPIRSSKAYAGAMISRQVENFAVDPKDRRRKSEVYLIKYLPKISDALERGGGGASTGAVGAGSWSILGAILNPIGSIVSSLTGGISRLVEGVGSTISSSLKTVLSVPMKVFDGLGTLLSSIDLTDPLGTIHKVLAGLTKTLQSMVGSIPLIGGLLSSLFSPILGLLDMTFGFLKKQFGGVVSMWTLMLEMMFAPFIVKMAEFLTDMEPVFGAVSKWLEDLVKQMMPKVIAMIDSVVAFWKGKTFSQGVTEIWTNVKAGVTNLWDKFSKWWDSTAVKWIKDNASVAWEATKKWFAGGFLTIMKKVGQFIIDGLAKAWKEIKDGVYKLAEVTKDQVENKELSSYSWYDPRLYFTAGMKAGDWVGRTVGLERAMSYGLSGGQEVGAFATDMSPEKRALKNKQKADEAKKASYFLREHRQRRAGMSSLDILADKTMMKLKEVAESFRQSGVFKYYVGKGNKAVGQKSIYGTLGSTALATTGRVESENAKHLQRRLEAIDKSTNKVAKVIQEVGDKQVNAMAGGFGGLKVSNLEVGYSLGNISAK